MGLFDNLLGGILTYPITRDPKPSGGGDTPKIGPILNPLLDTLPFILSSYNDNSPTGVQPYSRVANAIKNKNKGLFDDSEDVATTITQKGKDGTTFTIKSPEGTSLKKYGLLDGDVDEFGEEDDGAYGIVTDADGNIAPITNDNNAISVLNDIDQANQLGSKTGSAPVSTRYDNPGEGLFEGQETGRGFSTETGSVQPYRGEAGQGISDEQAIANQEASLDANTIGEIVASQSTPQDAGAVAAGLFKDLTTPKAIGAPDASVFQNVQSTAKEDANAYAGLFDDTTDFSSDATTDVTAPPGPRIGEQLLINAKNELAQAEAALAEVNPGDQYYETRFKYVQDRKAHLADVQRRWDQQNAYDAQQEKYGAIAETTKQIQSLETLKADAIASGNPELAEQYQTEIDNLKGIQAEQKGSTSAPAPYYPEPSQEDTDIQTSTLPPEAIEKQKENEEINQKDKADAINAQINEIINSGGTEKEVGGFLQSLGANAFGFSEREKRALITAGLQLLGGSGINSAVQTLNAGFEAQAQADEANVKNKREAYSSFLTNSPNATVTLDDGTVIKFGDLSSEQQTGLLNKLTDAYLNNPDEFVRLTNELGIKGFGVPSSTGTVDISKFSKDNQAYLATLAPQVQGMLLNAVAGGQYTLDDFRNGKAVINTSIGKLIGLDDRDALAGPNAPGRTNESGTRLFITAEQLNDPSFLENMIKLNDAGYFERRLTDVTKWTDADLKIAQNQYSQLRSMITYHRTGAALNEQELATIEREFADTWKSSPEEARAKMQSLIRQHVGILYEKGFELSPQMLLLKKFDFDLGHPALKQIFQANATYGQDSKGNPVVILNEGTENEEVYEL